jgi:UDP-glucose 4-epimerase
MTILVTGGHGNLGSWITDHLAEQDYDVTILGRAPNQFVKTRSISFIECDLTQTSDVSRKLKGEAFDHVIHLSSANDGGSPGYAELALRVNALGTRNLLGALDTGPLKSFQYFSTFHVYGQQLGTITEDTPLKPRHDYASTHLFAEVYVRQFHATHGLPYVIWRLSNSYGAPKHLDSTKWNLVLNDLSRMALEKGEIRLNSNGLAQRDFIWMGDVCKAVAAFIEQDKAPCSVFNLGSGRTWRMLDVAHSVQRAYRRQFGREIPVEVNKADTSLHDQNLTFNCDKLQALFPFEAEDRFESEARGIFNLLSGNNFHG